MRKTIELDISNPDVRKTILQSGLPVEERADGLLIMDMDDGDVDTQIKLAEALEGAKKVTFRCIGIKT